MKQFNLVPGSPYPHWQKSSFSWEKHFFFSYSRHAMIEFLKFIKVKKKYPTIKLLSPQYMCHEVINSLKQLDAQITYYSQQNDFSFDLSQLEKLIQLQEINVLFVSHLYGKYCHQLKELSEICQKYNVVLLEDLAHLPWFELAEKTQYSQAQFFSYRKLFSIPYGASCLVHDNDQEGFSDYYRNKMVKIKEPGAISTLSKSLIREQAKKLIIKSGFEWKRSYAELGIDPLKEFNLLPEPLIYQLKHVKTAQFVSQRRKNFIKLQQAFRQRFQAWSFLDFDCAESSLDVPYSFLFFKEEKINSVEIINRFLSRGISLVKGLELHPEVVRELGVNHPFNNQLALPLHQDITEEQVEHMINVCGEILI